MVQTGHSVLSTTIENLKKDNGTRGIDGIPDLKTSNVLHLHEIISGRCLIKGLAKDVDVFRKDLERIRQYYDTPPNIYAFEENQLEAEWKEILDLFMRVDRHFLVHFNKETSFHQQASHLAQGM